jgi:hypothetical protein
VLAWPGKDRLFAPGICEKISAPKSVAPEAPPVDRASEFIAVAEPRCLRPAIVWTTT